MTLSVEKELSVVNLHIDALERTLAEFSSSKEKAELYSELSKANARRATLEFQVGSRLTEAVTANDENDSAPASEWATPVEWAEAPEWDEASSGVSDEVAEEPIEYLEEEPGEQDDTDALAALGLESRPSEAGDSELDLEAILARAREAE